MGRAVGIDLGTTNSAVAVMHPAGPEILRNREGDNVTPSVVLFQDFGQGDEPLVGALAKLQATDSPEDIVQHAKRYIGDPYWLFDSAAGGQYSATEVSALILKRLKQDAELALGEVVSDAVITVPAYFDDARRTATKQAGAMAGLNVLRVINEPTAAALAYGFGGEVSATVLVYDLGGGTFDVTALRIDAHHFDVLATDGDRNLGGFDFDNALMNIVARKLNSEGSADVLQDLDAMAELREKCEVAKKTLSNLPKVNVQVTVDGRPHRVSVTREEFQRETQSLVNRTEELIQDVMEEARLTWPEVDRVLLVGGSTRMPDVRDLVTRLSGRVPEVGVNPDEVVALGAAIRASMEADSQPHEPTGQPEVTISDVTSQALGVIVIDRDTDADVNEVVIPRNSKVPSRHTAHVRTITPNQEQVRIDVTQGDAREPKMVTVVGSSLIDLPAGLPLGSPLAISYSYDLDQTIGIEVHDGTTGELLGEFGIQRVQNLSESELEAAIARIYAMSVS